MRSLQRRRRTPARLAYLLALEAPDHHEMVTNLLGIQPYFVDLTAFARDHALAKAAMDALPD
ncbi:MAG: hypothetical protein JKX91_03030 [Rhizobiaceae bacterium]|nr:hypothetical protein [Rhizobiaceae bacterium]